MLLWDRRAAGRQGTDRNAQGDTQHLAKAVPCPRSSIFLCKVNGLHPACADSSPFPACQFFIHRPAGPAPACPFFIRRQRQRASPGWERLCGLRDQKGSGGAPCLLARLRTPWTPSWLRVRRLPCACARAAPCAGRGAPGAASLSRRRTRPRPSHRDWLRSQARAAGGA